MPKDMEKLRLQRTSLNKQKAALTTRIQEILAEITTLNARLTKTLPFGMFDKLDSQRSNIVVEKLGIEKQLIAVKLDLTEIGDALHANEDISTNASSCINITKELVEIRDYYQEYAADHSRVSSRKEMAAEFALKLTKLIRKM